MYPKGSRDETGHKRTEGRCDLCGQRVWWCLAPPAPYSILPFEDNGDHHWWKCEEGLKIEDKVERTMRMLSKGKAKEYRRKSKGAGMNRKVDLKNDVFIRMPVAVWIEIQKMKGYQPGACVEMRAAVGRELSTVRYYDPDRCARNLGKHKRIDIDYEESEPTMRDWQKMLTGLKPGDKVRIINLVEQEE